MRVLRTKIRGAMTHNADLFLPKWTNQSHREINSCRSVTDNHFGVSAEDREPPKIMAITHLAGPFLREYAHPSLPDGSRSEDDECIRDDANAFVQAAGAGPSP